MALVLTPTSTIYVDPPRISIEPNTDPTAFYTLTIHAATYNAPVQNSDLRINRISGDATNVSLSGNTLTVRAVSQTITGTDEWEVYIYKNGDKLASTTLRIIVGGTATADFFIEGPGSVKDGQYGEYEAVRKVDWYPSATYVWEITSCTPANSVICMPGGASTCQVFCNEPNAHAVLQCKIISQGITYFNTREIDIVPDPTKYSLKLDNSTSAKTVSIGVGDTTTVQFNVVKVGAEAELPTIAQSDFSIIKTSSGTAHSSIDYTNGIITITGLSDGQDKYRVSYAVDNYPICSNTLTVNVSSGPVYVLIPDETEITLYLKPGYGETNGILFYVEASEDGNSVPKSRLAISQTSDIANNSNCTLSLWTDQTEGNKHKITIAATHVGNEVVTITLNDSYGHELTHADIIVHVLDGSAKDMALSVTPSTKTIYESSSPVTLTATVTGLSESQLSYVTYNWTKPSTHKATTPGANTTSSTLSVSPSKLGSDTYTCTVKLGTDTEMDATSTITVDCNESDYILLVNGAAATSDVLDTININSSGSKEITSKFNNSPKRPSITKTGTATTKSNNWNSTTGVETLTYTAGSTTGEDEYIIKLENTNNEAVKTAKIKVTVSDPAAGATLSIAPSSKTIYESTPSQNIEVTLTGVEQSIIDTATYAWTKTQDNGATSMDSGLTEAILVIKPVKKGTDKYKCTCTVGSQTLTKTSTIIVSSKADDYEILIDGVAENKICNISTNSSGSNTIVTKFNGNPIQPTISKSGDDVTTGTYPYTASTGTTVLSYTSNSTEGADVYTIKLKDTDNADVKSATVTVTSNASDYKITIDGSEIDITDTVNVGDAKSHTIVTTFNGSAHPHTITKNGSATTTSTNLNSTSGTTNLSYNVTATGTDTYEVSVKDTNGTVVKSLTIAVNASNPYAGSTMSLSASSNPFADGSTTTITAALNGSPTGFPEGTYFEWSRGDGTAHTSKSSGDGTSALTIRGNSAGTDTWTCAATNSLFAIPPLNRLTASIEVTVSTNSDAYTLTGPSNQTINIGDSFSSVITAQKQGTDVPGSRVSVACNPSVNSHTSWNYTELNKTFAAVGSTAGTDTFTIALNDEHGTPAKSISFTITVNDPYGSGALNISCNPGNTIDDGDNVTLTASVTGVDASRLAGITYAWAKDVGIATSATSALNLSMLDLTSIRAGNDTWRCTVSLPDKENWLTTAVVIAVNANTDVYELNIPSNQTINIGEFFGGVIEGKKSGILLPAEQLTIERDNTCTTYSYLESSRGFTCRGEQVGEDTFTVTLKNSLGDIVKTKSFTITVVDPYEDTSLSISVSPATINENQQATLTATVNLPEGASMPAGVIYEWTLLSGNSTTILSGVGSNSLVVKGVTAGEDEYKCTVTGIPRTTLSKSASVKVAVDVAKYSLTVPSNQTIDVSGIFEYIIVATYNGTSVAADRVSVECDNYGLLAHTTFNYINTSKEFECVGISTGTDIFTVRLYDNSNTEVISKQFSVTVADPYESALLSITGPNDIYHGETEEWVATVTGVSSTLASSLIYTWITGPDGVDDPISIVDGQGTNTITIQGDKAGQMGSLKCTAQIPGRGDYIPAVVGRPDLIEANSGSILVHRNPGYYVLTADQDTVDIDKNDDIVIHITATYNGDPIIASKLGCRCAGESTEFGWDPSLRELWVRGIKSGTDIFTISVRENPDDVEPAISIDITVNVIDSYENATLTIDPSAVDKMEGDSFNATAIIGGVDDSLKSEAVYTWTLSEPTKISITDGESTSSIDVICKRSGSAQLKCTMSIGDRVLEGFCDVNISVNIANYSLKVGGSEVDLTHNININSTSDPIVIEANNGSLPASVLIEKESGVYTTYEWKESRKEFTYKSGPAVGTDVYKISVLSSVGTPAKTITLTVNVVNPTSNSNLNISGPDKIDLRCNGSHIAQYTASLDPSTPAAESYAWSTSSDSLIIASGNGSNTVSVVGNTSGNNSIRCEARFSQGTSITANKTIMVEGYSISLTPSSTTIMVGETVDISIIATKDGARLGADSLSVTGDNNYTHCTQNLGDSKITITGTLQGGSDAYVVTVKNSEGTGVATATATITVSKDTPTGNIRIDGPGSVMECDATTAEFTAVVAGALTNSGTIYTWEVQSNSEYVEAQPGGLGTPTCKFLVYKAGIQVRIKCTAFNMGVTEFAYKEFSVVPNARIYNLSINPGNLQLSVGEEKTNSVGVSRDFNGVEAQIHEDVDITSSNLLITRTSGEVYSSVIFEDVSDFLKVKGITPGINTYKVEFKDATSGNVLAEKTFDVTVTNPIANARLILTPEKEQINENETISITASIEGAEDGALFDIIYTWGLPEEVSMGRILRFPVPPSGPTVNITGNQIGLGQILCRCEYRTLYNTGTLNGNAQIEVVSDPNAYKLFIDGEEATTDNREDNKFIGDTGLVIIYGKLEDQFIIPEVSRIITNLDPNIPDAVSPNSYWNDLENQLEWRYACCEVGTSVYKFVLKNTNNAVVKTFTLTINVTDPLENATLTMDPRVAEIEERESIDIQAKLEGVADGCIWEPEYHWQIVRGESDVINFTPGTPDLIASQATIKGINVGEGEVTCTVKYIDHPWPGQTRLILPETNSIITVKFDDERYNLYIYNELEEIVGNEDTIYAGQPIQRTRYFSAERLVDDLDENNEPISYTQSCDIEVNLPQDPKSYLGWDQDLHILTYTGETNKLGDDVIEIKILDAGGNVVKNINYTIHVLDIFADAAVTVHVSPGTIDMGASAEVGASIVIPNGDWFTRYMRTIEWIVTESNGPHTEYTISPDYDYFSARGIKAGDVNFKCKVTSVAGTVKESSNTAKLTVKSALGGTDLNLEASKTTIPILNGYTDITATIIGLPSSVTVSNIEWSINRNDVDCLQSPLNKNCAQINTLAGRATYVTGGNNKVKVTCTATISPGDEKLAKDIDINLIPLAEYYNAIENTISIKASPETIYINEYSVISFEYDTSLIDYSANRPTKSVISTNANGQPSFTTQIDQYTFMGSSAGKDEFDGILTFIDGSTLTSGTKASISVTSAAGSAKPVFICNPASINVGELSEIKFTGFSGGTPTLGEKRIEIKRVTTPADPIRYTGTPAVNAKLAGKLVGEEKFKGIITFTNDEKAESAEFTLTINGFKNTILGNKDDYINIQPGWNFDIYIGETKEIIANIINLPEQVKCTRLYITDDDVRHTTYEKILDNKIKITGVSKTTDYPDVYRLEMVLDDDEIITIPINVNVKDQTEEEITFSINAEEFIYITQTTTIDVNYSIPVPSLLKSITISNVTTGSEVTHESTNYTDSLWTLYGGAVGNVKGTVIFEFKSGANKIKSYPNQQLMEVRNPVTNSTFTISVDPTTIYIGEEADVKLDWQWPADQSSTDLDESFNKSFNIDRV